MLPVFKSSKSDFFLKTLSAWMYNGPEDNLDSRTWNILVSCHGIHFMTEQSLNYLHTEIGQYFSIEKLIHLVKSDVKKVNEMHLCEFNKSLESFFRRGKLPACAGGFDSYNDLVEFNKRKEKQISF